MKPIRNYGFIKPNGGLWTSTLNGDSSDWIRWCEDNEFRVPGKWRGWTLKPVDHARIYRVDSVSSATWLFSQYATDLRVPFWLLDFEAVAWEWDAIHLTVKGEIVTRMMQPITFYGWDCESTLWFRWMFTSVAPWHQNRQPRRTSENVGIATLDPATL